MLKASRASKTAINTKSFVAFSAAPILLPLLASSTAFGEGGLDPDAVKFSQSAPFVDYLNTQATSCGMSADFLQNHNFTASPADVALLKKLDQCAKPYSPDGAPMAARLTADAPGAAQSSSPLATNPVFCFKAEKTCYPTVQIDGKTYLSSACAAPPMMKGSQTSGAYYVAQPQGYVGCQDRRTLAGVALPGDTESWFGRIFVPAPMTPPDSSVAPSSTAQ